IKDVRELNSLFTTIAFNSGSEFSYDVLSKRSGVSKDTIKRYIQYLEAAFLIKVVNRVRLSGKRFQRAVQFKIYLTNPSLRSALFSPITQEMKAFGNMVETAIFSQWFHRHWKTPFYANWKGGEVDIVGIRESDLRPSWAVEIKWSNRFFERPRELKSLIQFMKENQLNRAVVTTIDKEGVQELGDLKIDFMPAALYAYTIGERTLVE
ncbi:MAG: DUF4143 domain-containing protein, partial [Bacteroidota bacterium]